VIYRPLSAISPAASAGRPARVAAKKLVRIKRSEPVRATVAALLSRSRAGYLGVF
jgi:hypothetical protein